MSLGAKRTICLLGSMLLAVSWIPAQGTNTSGQGNVSGSGARIRRDPNQSPAALPRPKTSTPQTYSAAQVQAGELRFAAQCAFCHGRDATGGESGPDLTRSELVAQDMRGDKIRQLLRTGRVDAGMPKFDLADAELDAMVAFIHAQMEKLAVLKGGKRSVEPSDLRTGNAADGRAYFNGIGGCAACHSATGDLAGIASRYQGFALLRRMLFPSGRPEPSLPKATFTLASGETVVVPLVAEDEFTVTVLDPMGSRQTYSRDAVNVKIDNPISAHFTQLGKYNDAAMHNVFAYLDTLK